MGVLQGSNARQLFASQVHEALERGATLRSETCTSFFGDFPVLLTDVPSNSRLLVEETFGPIVCASSFSSEADAVALANQSSFALGSSVWTADIQRAHRVAAAINAGSCAINDVIRNIGNPSASFGGNSKSGFGRYRGAEGLLAFTRTQDCYDAFRQVAHARSTGFPLPQRRIKACSFLSSFATGQSNLLTALRRCAHIALLLIAAGAARSQTTRSRRASAAQRSKYLLASHGAVGLPGLQVKRRISAGQKEGLRARLFGYAVRLGSLISMWAESLPGGTQSVPTWMKMGITNSTQDGWVYPKNQ